MTILLSLALLLSAPFFHAPHDPISAWAISPDFAHDQTLWVGQNSFGCVLRSTDGGQTFHTVNSGLDTAYVNVLAVSPDYAHDRTIWCSELAGVFRSHDGGDRWEQVSLDLTGTDVVAIAFSPAYATDRTLVLALRRGGLRISSDGGATWQARALPEKLTPVSVVPSPGFAQDGALLVVTRPAKVLLSRDRGASFSELRAPPVAEITCVLPADDFATSGRLWLGTVGEGVLLSEDAGQTWKRDGGGLDKGEVLHLAGAHDPSGGAVQFAATVKDGVFLRKPGGGWFKDGKGLRELSDQNPRHYFAALPSPAYAQDRTVFVASFEGLQRSTDGGFKWQYLKVLPEQFVRNVDFSPAFADDRTLWIGTYGLGTLLSSDGGTSWLRLNTGPWGFPDGLCVSPDYASDRTFMVGSPKALLLTSDAGETFRSALPQGQPGFLHAGGFAPDYAHSGLILMHNLEFGNTKLNDFLRSEDRGQTWTRTGPTTIHALVYAHDFTTSGRVFVATPEDVQASADRGKTWTPLPGLPRSNWYGLTQGLGPDGRECLVATSPQAGTHASFDQGQTWAVFDQGLERMRSVAVASTPTFAQDGLLFLLTQNEGLFKRRLGEPAWTYTGLRGNYSMRVTVSPSFGRDRTLAVATHAGAWLSRDAGETWGVLDVWGGKPGQLPTVKGQGPAPTGKTPGPRLAGSK